MNSSDYDIQCHALNIPFKTSFRHASAERSATAAIWVEARGPDGVVGMGEGCPREYVTGESVASAMAFVNGCKGAVAESVHDLDTLRAWLAAHKSEINENPAAWCALELALLDLFARRRAQSVEAMLGVPPITGPFVYSAVLGATGTKAFSATLERYQQAGLKDFKVKLSGDLVRDRDNLAILNAAGVEPERVRADANNLWADSQTARDYLVSLGYRFTAVEEPLQPGDYDGLLTLSRALDVPIVLDESIVHEDQLTQLGGEPERWIVNLRVSKMGGLLRSLQIADRCRKEGFSIVVGAQVGETSLLTRAALTVAQSARDMGIAQEGAFGTFLLAADAVTPTLAFGRGGVLDVGACDFDRAYGFGLSPSSDLQRSISSVDE